MSGRFDQQPQRCGRLGPVSPDVGISRDRHWDHRDSGGVVPSRVGTRPIDHRRLVRSSWSQAFDRERNARPGRRSGSDGSGG